MKPGRTCRRRGRRRLPAGWPGKARGAQRERAPKPRAAKVPAHENPPTRCSAHPKETPTARTALDRSIAGRAREVEHPRSSAGLLSSRGGPRRNPLRFSFDLELRVLREPPARRFEALAEVHVDV